MAQTTRSVLQVITSTDRRGAEVFATELADALGTLGWSVRTVALAPGAGTVRLDVPTLGRRPLGITTLRALRAEMRRADVTIAHGSRTLPASAIAGLGTGSPVVYRNIGDPRFWVSTWLRKVRVRWSIRRTVAVVALADAAAAVLTNDLHVDPDSITVIPQAGDGSEFHPATEQERAAARRALDVSAATPVVALVGALSAEKDPVLAATAVAGIADAHLVVAGDGPMRADLERGDALPPDRIHLLGVVDDATAVYAAADTVLLTSRSEGMPAVLVEAALCAVPVVTTDVGFVRAVVVDGETGLVVASREPAEIAAALRTALAERDRMGAAARAHAVEHFDLAAVARAWDVVLASATRT